MATTTNGAEIEFITHCDACGRYVEQRDVRDRECGCLDIKELCKACARRVDDAVQMELRRIKAGSR